MQPFRRARAAIPDSSSATTACWWSIPSSAKQRAQVAALVEPQITYDHILEVNLGSRLVRVVYLPGHTGGDSVVYIPDANVVFAGDLAWNQRIPNLIDATMSAWVETLDRMVAAHPNATFIP